MIIIHNKECYLIIEELEPSHRLSNLDKLYRAIYKNKLVFLGKHKRVAKIVQPDLDDYNISYCTYIKYIHPFSKQVGEIYEEINGTKYFYLNGLFHKEDGPFDYSGKPRFFIMDKLIPKKKYKKTLKEYLTKFIMTS